MKIKSWKVNRKLKLVNDILRIVLQPKDNIYFDKYSEESYNEQKFSSIEYLINDYLKDKQNRRVD